MINWFSKRLPDDFFRGVCDVHCHVLPGVDDGFQTSAKSIEALKLLEKKGVALMTLTPHFMKEYPKNHRERIITHFELFKAKVEEAGVGIELHLAAEYMLDRCFMDHYQEGFLTLDKAGVNVLCETSYMMYERNATGMLYDIMCAGYQPIIAHPERYEYASIKDYKHWKDKDYKFQLNLLSLAGTYGEGALVKSHHMLKEGLYDYVGSDMHSIEAYQKFIPRLRLKKELIDKLWQLLENNKRLVG